jgi:predicted nucleic acid-binding protein
MRRFVLDTNVLVQHWRRSRSGGAPGQVKELQAGVWARRLIDLENTNAIVTPVVLEYLCGVRDQMERGLTRAYLKPFESVDKGRILAADWREAKRLAERVPRNGRPRDFSDCLIKAIATRLNYQVRSFDTGLPQ